MARAESASGKTMVGVALGGIGPIAVGALLDLRRLAVDRSQPPAD